MKSTVDGFKKELNKRIDLETDSMEMIGDLRWEFNGGKGGPKTEVGWAVWGIITSSANPQGAETWQGGLPNIGSAKCKADTCCVWRHAALAMEKRFRGQSGRCNAAARAAVRLGFHDAGTWSKFTEDYGGADGSIILSGLAGNEDELKRGENNGLQDISRIVTDWYNKYKPYGVGMADLIQMAANVATVVCPLGPRVRTFVGRIDSDRPAVNSLLPDVHAEAPVLIDLFENKTIRVHGLVALVGAHTTSQQHFVDVNRAGDPQDSTPGIWDVEFYSETTSNSAPARVFKFPSDVKLSRDSFASSEWNEFASGQSHWNEDYAKEYVRLSLLGVNNINSLTECTRVLPPRTDKVTVSDDNNVIKQWLKGGGSKKTSENLEEGSKVTKLEK
ncbi:class II peroxidase [Lentithecium fluviatile CBS 122367]|uniref:Peroxidase n=1 Tax=Lentithecium fluviatile CBS 122367 TaxID=1168545 RepID=A0A6G1IC47_9PLEO|nr:class II peroxidase [Lentithecium fluviatile CBS 122367]